MDKGLIDQEALYRQLARHSGLPIGLRPVLIKKAEKIARSEMEPVEPVFARRDAQGCKGAVAN